MLSKAKQIILIKKEKYIIYIHKRTHLYSTFKIKFLVK